jgi:hypothetical protein
MPLVVCDAGPLIHLDESGCLDLLSDFSEVLVPEAVWREVRQHRHPRSCHPQAAADEAGSSRRAAGIEGSVHAAFEAQPLGCGHP